MYCLFSLQPSSSSTGESKQDDDVDGEQTKCKDKEEVLSLMNLPPICYLDV